MRPAAMAATPVALNPVALGRRGPDPGRVRLSMRPRAIPSIGSAAWRP